jgi:hypothetical protein
MSGKRAPAASATIRAARAAGSLDAARRAAARARGHGDGIGSASAIRAGGRPAIDLLGLLGGRRAVILTGSREG